MISERNKPCPCGSGKKYKKCCINKKQRSTVVTGSFNEPTAINNLRFCPRTGKIEFYHDNTLKTPSKSSAVLSHERKRAPKIISSVDLNSGEMHAYPDVNLLRFAHVFGVDTNSKKTKSGTACVMAAIYTRPKVLRNRVTLIGKLDDSFAFEFWEPSVNAEKIGWRYALESITKMPEYLAGEKFGVVVDSHLSELEEINNRKIDIISNYVLPERITLIYGSSDKKNDSAINGLIHLADEISNVIYKQMAAVKFRKSGNPVTALYVDPRRWENVSIELSSKKLV